MEPMELWLRISVVSRLNAVKACTIVERLISCGEFHYNSLLINGLNENQCREFIHADPKHILSTLKWLENPSNHMIIYNGPYYPPLLKQIVSAPVLLFVAGDYHVLHYPQIALVGSRQFTHYGEHWGRYFSSELVRCGLTITSGLAIGIDGICHQAALDAEGKTIAVLGSGLENIYPRRHHELASKIQERGGVLVSEFLTTALPMAVHFPRRNRIISGLSIGVAVVEATLKSGSLITARYALEQGRDVFALPGPLGSPMSEGVHWLIQQGAYLATSPKDILEQVRSALLWLSLEEQNSSLQESKIELPFADVLANVGDEVTPVDIVAERAGQSVPDILIKLLDLELAGLVAVVPGGYVRVRGAGHA